MPNTSHSASASSSQMPTVAKPAVRLAAIVYDGMLILAMLFLVGAALAVLGTVLFLDVGTTSQEAKTLPIWYQNAVMTPAFVLTLVGFYGIFWRKSGQTLGMQTWRLKTVNDQGGLLTWRQSFVRIISACLLPALCAVIGALLHGSKLAILVAAVLGFLFNFLFCLFNRRGLAVHDMLSNTITLKVPKIAHESLWQTLKRRKNKA
ncbi:RDD family protein [Moraxella catarrhalis]|uniref:RDD family protein n=2 Tax=Moraxella TaxID=475 RepID=A0A198UV06_MORCA|nr:RDD family protein [Moraxella catarrhalis]OAU98016.1 RDD family protein [Moraxella catarrhalis]OAU98894.1 RDD family protein [Moraxella catarrhalis]OAV00359.1 RDD family protein [Moraxella catarrhalis]STY82612.1 RDD family [Moraxella catarrhalis]